MVFNGIENLIVPSGHLRPILMRSEDYLATLSSFLSYTYNCYRQMPGKVPDLNHLIGLFKINH